MKTRLLILLLSLCPSISYLHAVSADWNGGVDDFWGTAGNWSIAPAPGMGDTATFNAGDSGGATIIDFATIATLQVTAGSHSFSPGIGGLTANTVNVSTTGNTTFQSALLDIVNLTKTNSGILTLNGDNTIGAIAHDGGSLVLGNGSQTISNINQTGGTLNTAGNAAAITGNVNVATGTISPGGNAAIATLNITGNFTLGAAGIYELNILPTQTDLISATGTVTLTNGNTLNVKPLPGVYTRGTTYNIITGAGGVNGTITNLVEVHSLNFSTSVVDNDVVLTILQDTVMLPVPLSSLKGNSQVMGNYMFSNNRVLAGTPDLTNINNRLFSLSAEEFTSALIQLSPLASAAVPQATYQNDIQMAVVLDKQFQKSARKKPTQSKKKKKKEESEFSCYQTPKTGLFIEPIGVFYNQRNANGDLTDNGQVEFNAYTYGAGLGWEQVINNHFIIEGGIGYTHSNLIFDSNFGNSRWSTLYVAPFFGWFNEKAFGNFMVMGAFNFIRTHRRISFSGLERIAKGNYISYDLLLRANGGFYFNLGNNFLLQPEATLNYLTIFTSSYTEKEANSVSLAIQNNTDYIMQPSVRMRLVKEYVTKKFCYAPNIYVGWLANILLKNQTLSARFRDGPSSLVFTIDGYNGTTNQLILGTEFYAQRFDRFLLTSGFEVDMLSHFEIYTVKIKFEWMF